MMWRLLTKQPFSFDLFMFGHCLLACLLFCPFLSPFLLFSCSFTLFKNNIYMYICFLACSFIIVRSFSSSLFAHSSFSQVFFFRTDKIIYLSISWPGLRFSRRYSLSGRSCSTSWRTTTSAITTTTSTGSCDRCALLGAWARSIGRERTPPPKLPNPI